MFTTLYINFSEAQGQITLELVVVSGRNLNSSKLSANSAVLGPVLPNFKFVRDVMDVLIACKYEEDPIKNEGARVFTTFSPLYSYGSYRLPWTPEFCSDLVQNLMHAFPLPNDASDKI